MIVGLLAILKLHLMARGKFMLGSSHLCSCSRSVSLTQTEVECGMWVHVWVSGYV